MAKQEIERLIKRLIVKNDHMLLKDQTGMVHIREDVNVLLKQCDHYVNYLQVIDGDTCTLEWIQQRLCEADNVLHNLREKNKVGYSYAIIYLDQEAEKEKEAYIRSWQEQHLTEVSQFKCFIVDTRKQTVEKLFSRATRDSGLLKVIEQALQTEEEEWEKSSVEELVAEQIEGRTLEYKVDKPIVTYSLITINVLIFVILMAYEKVSGISYNELIYTYGAKVNSFILEGEYWRLFTAMFLHGSLTHLLVNCYSLLVLGALVERLFGRGKFIGSYLIAGIVGNVISFVFVDGYSVGASGAIFGLMGMLLFYGLEKPTQFKYYFSRSILITIVINLVFGFSNAGIDNSAHLGGLVGGFLAIGALSKSQMKKWYTNRILYLVALSAIIGGGLYYGFNSEKGQITRRVAQLEVLEKEQDWARLEEEGKAILEMNPTQKDDQINILWVVAKAEMMQGKYEEAISYGKQLATISPENGHYICGIAYLNLGKDDLGIESLQKAVEAGNSQAQELLDAVMNGQ